MGRFFYRLFSYSAFGDGPSPIYFGVNMAMLAIALTGWLMVVYG